MTIHLAEGLTLPEDAATQVFAFLGRRGSGKTFGAGRLVEQLHHAGAQVVILDPVGVWWGLRLAADGKSPGLKIHVFGGAQGDLPLQATAGKVVAELVAEQGISLVLDLSEFTLADQRRFVADFAGELLHAKKRNRSPVMVVLEEAQEFAPQNVRGDMARMVGAVERLVKLGRNFGVGATLLSQRPQAVNKDILNLSEILLAFQLTGPQERKTIQGWVQEKGAEGREEIADLLPSLPVGTAMVWSPQWLGTFGKHRILAKKTFDASATPKAGKAARTVELAPIDLEAVQRAMAATIEQAKANDPAALKAEVARLRRELEAARKTTSAPGKPTEVRVEVVPRIVLEGLRDLRETLRVAAAALTTATKDADAYLDDAGHFDASSARPPRPPKAFPTNPDGHKSFRVKVPRLTSPPAPNGEWRPPGGALRMLQAIATSHADGLTWRQVAQLSGMKASGGSFGTYKSQLRTHGCIEERGDLVFLSEAGQAFTGEPPPPMSGIELLEYWKQKLPGKAKRMLECVWAVGPKGSITRDALAREADIEVRGGSFGTYLSRLRSNGLVEDGPNGLTAAEVFFR